MDPGKIFQIITNSTLLATRLLSGTGRTVLEFTQHRYCAVLREDAPASSDVTTVVANHKEGAAVRYSITGGNRDGLFTIDQKTGLITLAAALDYELHDKHELVVSGEGGGQVVHTIVQVAVSDVNDNPPVFLRQDPHVTVIEEDDRHLPATLVKVEAKDPDRSDESGLLYTLRGDGVDGYSFEDAFFKINPRSGDLVQLRALDRDPPHGKRIWKLRVKVQDGQEPWDGGTAMNDEGNNRLTSSNNQNHEWDYDQSFQRDEPVRVFSEYEVGSKRHLPKSLQLPSQYSQDFILDHEGGGKEKYHIRDKSGSYQPLETFSRRRSWNHERIRKAKARQLSWNAGSGSQRSYLRGTWKFKEVSRKEERDLSRNDQERKSGTRYQPSWTYERDGDEGETWELSKRIQGDRKGGENEWEDANDTEGSYVKGLKKAGGSERMGSGMRKSDRIIHKREHINNGVSWHPGRLKGSSSDASKRTLGETEYQSLESNFKEATQKQGVRDRLSVNKVGSRDSVQTSRTFSNRKRRGPDQEVGEITFVPELTSTDVVNNKVNEMKVARESTHTRRRGEDSEIIVVDNGCDSGSTNCDYYFKDKTYRIRNGDIIQTSKGGYDTYPIAKSSYDRKNKPDGAIGIQDGEGYSYGSPDYLISLDDFNRPKISRKLTRWNSKTNLWKEVDVIDDSAEMDVESRRYMKKSKRSPNTSFNKVDNHSNPFSLEHIKSPELYGNSSSSKASSLRRGFSFSRPSNLREVFSQRIPTENEFTAPYSQTSAEVSQEGSSSEGLIDTYYNLSRSLNYENLHVSPNTISLSERISAAVPGDAKPKYVRKTEYLTSKRMSKSYDRKHDILKSGSKNIESLLLAPDSSFPISKSPTTKVSTFTKEKSGTRDFVKVSTNGGSEQIIFKRSRTTKSLLNHKRRTSVLKPRLRLGGHMQKPVVLSRAAQNGFRTKIRETRSSNSRNQYEEGKAGTEWAFSYPQQAELIYRGSRQAAVDLPFDHFDLEEEECNDISYINNYQERSGESTHEVEMLVTIFVKDINDNAPAFPNVTMFGEVQENGPVALSVAEVSAWDADDSTEGTNARITYAIEKNVIHDKSGEAIFNVDPQSGLVTTALCCLDRETTPEYHIQVVAADGGGLKGTGTVVVRLTDENDNSPRLARQYWELEVDETWGDGPPNNITLLEMTAADPDTKNMFSYKVVEESGWGWDHFGIRSAGASGQLYALKKLDYEDDTHRRGFKFMVQVTDRGDSGWADPRHQDTAWVGVKLKDLNDNPPQFVRPHARVTVSEDARPSTLLTTISAHDPDMGGSGNVDYQVIGAWDALRVDANGGVTLHRPLDREAENGAEGIAKILGTDRGDPPLTATATLTITVTDVNDCPPRLLPPEELHVTEGEPPSLLGLLTATDDDIWALGHGPPFNLTLSPTNPKHVTDLIDLKFDQRVDSGRGGAELWTRGSLDRETHRELPVEIIIGDAGGLTRTQIVRIVVNDLNDNPMKPAAKTVYLWKTQGSGSDAPLGRVYVEDPDDWDVTDKTFRWAGKPHPLFTLNQDDGTVFASSQVREGRYELQFAVSDSVWNQIGVSANVSVVVRTLTHDALTHAAPIVLTPTTPADLTRGWTPTSGGGGLGKLLQSVREILSSESPSKVEVVSVYGNYAPLASSSTVSFVSSKPTALPSSDHHKEGQSNDIKSSMEQQPSPSACVWVSVKDDRGRFMDPVKLQGLLALHSKRLEKATNLSASLKDPAPVFEKRGTSGQRGQKKDPSNHPGYPPFFEEPEDFALSTLKFSHEEGPASVTSMASRALPLQVVDTNITSLVTPLLIRTHECFSRDTTSSSSYSPSYDSDTCTPSTCLNGGRCIRFPTGNRCVCPGGSFGPQCKVLSRSFKGSGWVWVKPLPPCFPSTVSVRVLTRKPHGLILYSGPLVPPNEYIEVVSSHGLLASPMLAIQVVDGFPHFIAEGIGRPLHMQINATINDGEWHTIHLHLHSQGVVMMVDMCGLGWEHKPSDDAHCVARGSWGIPEGLVAWESLGPLQLGGLAQGRPRPEHYGWKESPTPHPLDGCLSHFTVNGQLVDLGEPACSHGSQAGCQSQEVACDSGVGSCGIKGACIGGLNRPECHCEPGWSGMQCDSPTVPATLGSRSYMKLALSFTPPSRAVSVQVRVRTLGSRTGMLVHLAAQHTEHSFTVHLRAGVACASMSGAGWAARVACVEGRPVGDGQWHTILAERSGHNLLVSVDGGDEWRHNHSLPSLMATTRHSLQEEVTGPPMPLEIDKHDGVTIGGLPEFLGVKLVTVQDDLQETCVDDLRVSGRQLPLPPAVNGSSWGQVTTLDGLIQGCSAPSSCMNTTCEPPLACRPTWTQPSCSCGQGRRLVGHSCEDIDECLLMPCLHGGSCYNLKPGYACVCGPNHMGDNCEWAKVSNGAHPFTAPAAIAAVTVSLLILVLFGVFLSLRHHRLRAARGALGRQEGVEGGDKDSIIAVKTGCKGSVMALDPDKKESFLGLKGGWKDSTGTKTKGPEDESHTTFLELLKLSRAKPAKETKAGNSGTSSGVSVAVITTAGVSRSKDFGGVGTSDQQTQHHHLPGEDLRNYAYEGDGSSSGSLTSTISGLRAELEREEGGKLLATEFVEVMDLLKNLPEAPRSSVLLARLKEKKSLIKEVRDPEVISTVSMGSLRRKEMQLIGGGGPAKSSSSSCGRLPSKETRSIEMPSSKGRQLVCGKDELTTAC